MRAELISLRSRAEAVLWKINYFQSGVWRNTNTLESLISFQSLFSTRGRLSFHESNEKSRRLSRPLVLIGWVVNDFERWWEQTGQSPQSPGGLFNHREPLWKTLKSGLWSARRHTRKVWIIVCKFSASATPNSDSPAMVQVARFGLWAQVLSKVSLYSHDGSRHGNLTGTRLQEAAHSLYFYIFSLYID